VNDEGMFFNFSIWDMKNVEVLHEKGALNVGCSLA
jgi:hypothetical protein